MKSINSHWPSTKDQSGEFGANKWGLRQDLCSISWPKCGVNAVRIVRVGKYKKHEAPGSITTENVAWIEKIINMRYGDQHSVTKFTSAQNEYCNANTAGKNPWSKAVTLLIVDGALHYLVPAFCVQICVAGPLITVSADNSGLLFVADDASSNSQATAKILRNVQGGTGNKMIQEYRNANLSSSKWGNFQNSLAAANSLYFDTHTSATDDLWSSVLIVSML